MAERFTYSSVIDEGPLRVFEWHERPGAFERLTPPWLPVRLESSEGIRDGDRAEIRLGWGPLSISWVARHRDYVHGVSFSDEQVRGPFASWVHRREFGETADGACRLTDDITFEMPAGKAGALAAGCVVDSLRAQFAYRHAVTGNDLRILRKYSSRPLKIAITGASGLIGTALSAFLEAGGHSVLRLVRRRPAGEGEVYWNVRNREIDANNLTGVDVVIHLAGENLMAPRWTEAKKRRIYDSRIAGTKLVAEAIASLPKPPATFIVSSGVNIYGDRGAEVIDETASLDRESFLGRVCIDWENACDAAREAGIRTVNMRTGLVITGGGGALAPMLPLFKAGLGGRFGPSDTYLSWVSLDDVVGAIYHVACTDGIVGPVNLTAPTSHNWDQLAAAIGHVMHRPTFVSVPGWMTELATGEMGRNVILAGVRATPAVLEQTDYTFLYPDLESTLRHQLGYPSHSAT